MKVFRLAAWAIAPLLLTQLVQAQTQNGIPIGFAEDGPIGGSTTVLLQMSDVQKHLGLTSSQQIQIAETLRAARSDRRTLFENVLDGKVFDHPITHAELKSILYSYNRALEDRVEKEILDRGQVERLGQLSFQLQGMGSIFRPEVAVGLSLSEKQEAELAALREEITPEHGVTTVTDVDQLLSPLLADWQQERVREMQGETFPFEVLRRYAAQSRVAWENRKIRKRERPQLVRMR